VFLTLLWAAYQYRVRQLRREFRTASDARLEERMRIARELHDTLLQSFHGLLLRLQGTYNLLPGRAPEARAVLGSAIDDAAHAITEARDAVEDLRSTPVVCGELVECIRTLGRELAAGQQLADAATTAFSVDVEGEPRTLDPAQQDEIFRIASEGLRNAFHHARATRIEAEIRYDTRALRVRVRDDGIGIDPALLQRDGPAGHWGMKGMRERAKRIGGQLEVWSDHGAGTEVELTVPGSTAYASEPGRKSWHRKKKEAARS
jgi:signal transduction histidine kinase